MNLIMVDILNYLIGWNGLFNFNIIYFLKKIFRHLAFFCLITFALSQNVYQGEINFDYNGTVDGSFNSITQDSLITGIIINQIVNDTSLLIMASITQQEENEFDLFLAVLRDTIFPVQPRNWDIPGEGDESNPLSLESILVFMPQLDSSFVEEIFEIFTDTTGNQDSTLEIGDIFTSFSDNLYLGLDGNLEVGMVTDSSLTGTFSTVMIKPAFYFPPHTVSIDNGDFSFSNVEIPILKASDSHPLPSSTINLFPSYPNPFNPRTKITFDSPDHFIKVSVNIYNSNGQQMKSIYNGSLNSGINSFYWEPKNVASGVYFLVLQTPTSIQSQKLLYLK